jgi:3-hydroxyacyl-CoA dehydrogenase/enoyl-CoA hydratase/3-hydroxybutyryl-CoA epimerase
VTVDGLALESQQAAEREAAAFGRLAVTAECKNLIAVFRMTEAARKRMPEGVAAPVKRAAVVGAGVMGAGIAELFAYQSIPVQVADVATDRVEAGLMRARELLEKAAEKAGWSSDERARRLACLRGSTEYAGFEKADLVVEAVPERADLKRDVMASIEKHVRSSTVIATNTSALSVSDLQHALAHPGRVCGLHFFNPPHRMPLVEVVRGTKTSNGALATAFEIALRLGKTPIVVRDAPGFAVNRVLSAYLTEAGHLLQQGMTLESVDAVMERFGMPLGPLRLLDEIGLDVAAEVIHTMHAAYGERFGPAAAVERVLASGASGRKGGRGFYRYAGAKAKGVNPEVRSLLRSAARGRPPTDAEAEERMVFSMVNEAARVLDDHIVDAPQSLDIAMIMGAGFPPFRGGLLRYADAVGLERIANRLEHYAGSVAPRFAPATGLLRRRAFYPGPEPGR